MKPLNEMTTEEKQLEKFRDEMEVVWQEYQQTGQHATGEEIFAWMESWLAEDEKPIPAYSGCIINQLS